jgi:hypothetical protein
MAGWRECENLAARSRRAGQPLSDPMTASGSESGAH